MKGMNNFFKTSKTQRPMLPRAWQLDVGSSMLDVGCSFLTPR